MAYLKKGCTSLSQSLCPGFCAVGEVKEILGGGDPVQVGDFPWLVGILDVSLGEEVTKNETTNLKLCEKYANDICPIDQETRMRRHNSKSVSRPYFRSLCDALVPGEWDASSNLVILHSSRRG